MKTASANESLSPDEALVGGPNLDGYQDSVNDYVHNEVAIDYNAGLVGTAAFAVANP